MAFYNKAKAELLSGLSAVGFSKDSLGEGATKKIDSERICVVLVSGIWTHIEIKVGIRFNSVNDFLYNVALEAGWKKDACSFLKMKQTSLFFKKVGDFCGKQDDIDTYCPPDSVFADIDAIKHFTNRYVNEMSSIDNIDDAVSYYIENECFDPYGCMMFGASAISGKKDLFEWAKTLKIAAPPLLSSREVDSLMTGCFRKFGFAE